MALEQHERLGHRVRAPPPRRGTDRRDLTGADGLSVVLVLGIAKRAEKDALFGGHDRPNLAATVNARNRGARGHRRPHHGRNGGRSVSCGSGGIWVSPSPLSLRRPYWSGISPHPQ